MQIHLIPQEKPIIILLRKYELFQELAVGQICKCVISTMGVYEFFGYQNIVSGRGLFLWQFCLQSLCVVPIINYPLSCAHLEFVGLLYEFC